MNNPEGTVTPDSIVVELEGSTGGQFFDSSGIVAAERSDPSVPPPRTLAGFGRVAAAFFGAGSIASNEDTRAPLVPERGPLAASVFF